MAKRRCIVYVLPGLTHYETAWRYQRVLAEHTHQQKKACVANKAASWPTDHLLLLQHPRIFTLGRGATQKNLKFEVNEHGMGQSGQPEVLRVERGGEVTWHGPGQLVAYPIMDINNDRPGGGGDGENTTNAHKKDLHWYTTQLEETVITLLQAPPYRVPGVGRHEVNTGVWVSHGHGQSQHSKISAIGVTASRWITMHGLSLNVNPDMRDYSLIVPCGIEAEQVREASGPSPVLFGVCSMQQLLPKGPADGGGEGEPGPPVCVSTVLQHFERAFATVFQVQLEKPPDALLALEELLQQYPSIAAMRLPRSLAKT